MTDVGVHGHLKTTLYHLPYIKYVKSLAYQSLIDLFSSLILFSQYRPRDIV